MLHGGLFGEPGVLLEDIMTANRKDYGFNPEDLEGDAKQGGDPDASNDGSAMVTIWLPNKGMTWT